MPYITFPSLKQPQQPVLEFQEDCQNRLNDKMAFEKLTSLLQKRMRKHNDEHPDAQLSFTSLRSQREHLQYCIIRERLGKKRQVVRVMDVDDSE